jgi:hypothetical protein
VSCIISQLSINYCFRNDILLFKIGDEMRDENRSHSVDSAGDGGEESRSEEQVRVW